MTSAFACATADAILQIQPYKPIGILLGVYCFVVLCGACCGLLLAKYLKANAHSRNNAHRQHDPIDT